MTKWEYRTESKSYMLSSDLDDLGRQGWELVAVTVTSNSFGSPSQFRHFFKRQVKED